MDENNQRLLAELQERTDKEVGTSAGQTRTFLSTTGPYRNNQGHVIGLIGISRDVTNRKRLEAALAGNGCYPCSEWPCRTSPLRSVRTKPPGE